MNERIKTYQQSVFGNMPKDQGPADKKFVTTSKTGIPMTQAQDIIAKNQNTVAILKKEFDAEKLIFKYEEDDEEILLEV